MDGHEIIEIPFSELTKIIDFRIESEYFEKRFIKNENLLSKKTYKNFNLIATFNNGRAYSSEEFSINGDLYISKIGDVTNKRDINNWEKLSINEFNEQRGELLEDGDILMTLTGDPPDVGKTNLISTEGKTCTWNQRVAKINRRGKDYISNYALYPVVSSEICRIQLERFAKGIRQRNLGNDCFTYVKLPILGIEIQQMLELLIKKHIALLNDSKTLYSNAESILSKKIGVSINNHKEPNISIKNFGTSFKKVGRLDAEYYQSKYETYVNILHTADTVNSLCDIHDRNYDPNDKELYKYIELANVGKSGDISDVELILGSELPSRARRKVKTGQVIVSSVEGSLQSCALITDEFDGALCSTGFYVLTSERINPETLLVLFKSEVIQELMKQRCSGTILTAVSKGELLSMPLPAVDDITQKEITAKVQESFALRRKSKELFEAAKRAVEIAVEENEGAAIKWLKEKGV